MGRKVERTRNNGTWTEARYNSFIKGALRAATQRWGPIHKAKRDARVGYGLYLCAGHGRGKHKVPASLPPLEGKKRRINNAVVDHIKPIIDPKTGFINWDTVISRMFCEVDNLQVLCHECHSLKTQQEKQQRTKK
jgi:5-methylcytosine-specific restriction endonuclease McrA